MENTINKSNATSVINLKPNDAWKDSRVGESESDVLVPYASEMLQLLDTNEGTLRAT